MLNKYKSATVGFVVSIFAITSLFSGIQAAQASTGFYAYQVLLKTSAAMEKVDSMHFDMLVDAKDVYGTSYTTGLNISGNAQGEDMTMTAEILYDGSLMENMPVIHALAYQGDAYYKVEGIPEDYAQDFGSFENQWLVVEKELIEELYGAPLGSITTSELDVFDQSETGDLFKELVAQGVIVFDEFDFGENIDSMPTYRISYHVDAGQLAKYLEREFGEYLDEQDVYELSAGVDEFEQNAEIYGEIYIGQYDYLPYRLTLYVEDKLSDESVSVHLNMSKYNESFKIMPPKNAMSVEEILDEYIGEYDMIDYGPIEYDQADSDNDGLTDTEEVFFYETDPQNPDTDNDGYNDGTEVLNGYDPLGPGRM